jgi:hypothetical protein
LRCTLTPDTNRWSRVSLNAEVRQLPAVKVPAVDSVSIREGRLHPVVLAQTVLWASSAFLSGGNSRSHFNDQCAVVTLVFRSHEGSVALISFILDLPFVWLRPQVKCSSDAAKIVHDSGGSVPKRRLGRRVEGETDRRPERQDPSVKISDIQ